MIPPRYGDCGVAVLPNGDGSAWQLPVTFDGERWLYDAKNGAMRSGPVPDDVHVINLSDADRSRPEQKREPALLLAKHIDAEGHAV